MIALRSVFLLVALVLTSSVDLSAQEGLLVAPGDSVRVTAPTVAPDPLVGTLVSLGADACVLEVAGHAEPLRLPLASVTGLEVRREGESQTANGAFLGALFGGVAGAGIGIAMCSGGCEAEVPQVAAVYGGIGAGLGLLVGLSIGSESGPDRWVSVDLQSIRVSLITGRHGLAVSVQVAF